MNPHSLHRLQIARNIAPLYTSHPDVAAVVVCGSTARDLADRYSDLEMCVFWKRVPTDEERLAAIHAAGGTRIALYPYEDKNGDLPEEFLIEGMKIDMGHRPLDRTEERIADVVERFNPDLVRQDPISLIQDCIPIYGAPIVEGLRALTTPYPEELARVMVRQYLDFGSAWWPYMMAERGDLITLYEGFVHIERRVILVLLGLNRVYLHHLGFKWTEWLAKKLPIAPPNLAARLNSIFLADPLTAAHDLDILLRETIALVEAHMPEVDTSEVKAPGPAAELIEATKDK